MEALYQPVNEQEDRYAVTGERLGMDADQVRALERAAIQKLQPRPLTDDEEVAVVTKEVKQRRDSIDSYEKAERTELAAKEREELEILMHYAPQQLLPDEIERLARQAIAESGATSPKEMSKVMQTLMPAVRGKADGKVVSQIVQSLLTAS
jgi:uncharacterized protein YqeY